MKQNNKTTILKLVLLVICIASLATALVACGSKEKNSDNANIEIAETSIYSEKALESYLGFCIENNAHLYCQVDPGLRLNNGKFIGQTFMMSFAENDDSIAYADVIICKSESDAKNYCEQIINVDEDIFQITQNKNILIVEREKDFFQNIICESKIPESYHSSKLHMDMIKEAFKSITTCDDEVDDIEFAYEYGEDGEEFFYCHDMRIGYSQDKSWEFSNRKGDSYTFKQLEELLPKLKTDYTEDSFINLHEEGGYYSARLIDRPDTYRYEDYSYKDGEIKIDGIRITDYICTKDSSNSLVVPAKIDNKPVLDVTLERLNATTVELSEGIISFNIHNCKNLETIILPKSMKRIFNSYNYLCNFIEGCYSLKTIKYAGTKAEWEELVKYNDPNNWYVEREYDDETNEYIYKYITFKVECSDETITYSHE